MPDSNESDDSKEVESECADKEKHDSSFFWGFGAWNHPNRSFCFVKLFLTDPRQKMILFVCVRVCVQITLVCVHL